MRKNESAFTREWATKQDLIKKAIGTADRSDHAALEAIAGGLQLLADQVRDLTKEADAMGKSFT